METTVQSPSADDKKQAETASHARGNATRLSDRLFYTCAALLAIAAIALRLWGIDFGLPSLHQYDEWRVVAKALSFGATKNFHPGSWELGTLGMYVAFVLYVIYGGLGLAFGYFASIEDFAISYFVDPSPFYLIGRGLFFVCGMLSLYVVYLIGRKMAGRWAGLVSAAVLAFMPVHVSRSALAFPDTMMLLLMAGALYVMIRDREAVDDYRKDIYAGVLIGLAIAAKYVAIFMVFGYIAWRVATIWTDDLTHASALRRLGVGGISGAMGLFIGMPYFFLDLYDAVPGVLGLGSGGNVAFAESTALIELWDIATSPVNIGLIAIMSGVCGTVWALRRWPAFTVAMLAVMLTNLAWGMGRDRLMVRWLFGSELILCIGAGYFIARLYRSLNSRMPAQLSKAVALGFLLAALVLPAANTVKGCIRRTTPDTRSIAEEWIETNIPPGSKLLIVGGRALSPQLRANADSLRRWITRAEGHRHESYPSVTKYYRYNLKALTKVKEPSYNIRKLKFHGEVAPEYDVSMPLDSYISSGVEYIVTTPSSWKGHFAEDVSGRAQFRQDLVQTCTKTVTIEADEGQSGPTIVIWRTPIPLRSPEDAEVTYRGLR